MYNNQRRRARLAVASIAAAASVVGLSQATAQAHNPFPISQGCGSGALCVFPGEDFTGSKYQFFQNNSSWNGYAINNQDKSAANYSNSGNRAVFYDLTGYGVYIGCLAPSTSTGHRSPMQRTSSNQFKASC